MLISSSWFILRPPYLPFGYHTCVPHPEPSSLLPPHTIPLGSPSAPAPSTNNISFLYSPPLTSIHDYWKNYSFDYMDLCWQVMSLLFYILSRFVIVFLPRSKRLLISWLQSPSAVIFSSVQSLSRVRLFATPWIAWHQASLSITNSRSSLKLMSIELVMPSSHLILCRPRPLLPPFPPRIRVFSNESTLPMRWLKYWSFSFRISPSKEHPGLISFRMDWLDLLQSKGLSRVFSNTTVQKHQFFSAQLSLQSTSHIRFWKIGQCTIITICWKFIVKLYEKIELNL